jgi:glycosyltransferase involved in cell wall biosynthesis
VYLAQVIPDLKFIKKLSPDTKLSFIFHDAVLWPIEFEKLNGRIYKLDRIFCISNVIRDALIRKFENLNANNVIVLRNALQHAKNLNKKSLAFNDISIRKSSVFGFAGRFSHEKNIIGLIKSFQLLRKRYPDIRLKIAGDISLKNNLHLVEYKKDISTLIANDPNIEYLGHLTSLDEFYRSIDILILSSFIEGVSVAAIDALAYGVPVVSTRVGAMSEVIDDGLNGFLFDLDFIRPNPFDNYTIGFTNNEIQGFANILEKSLQKNWDRKRISNSAIDAFNNEKNGLLLYQQIKEMLNQN